MQFIQLWKTGTFDIFCNALTISMPNFIELYILEFISLHPEFEKVNVCGKQKEIIMKENQMNT